MCEVISKLSKLHRLPFRENRNLYFSAIKMSRSHISESLITEFKGSISEAIVLIVPSVKKNK